MAQRELFVWGITLAPPPEDRFIKTDADTQVLMSFVCVCVCVSVFQSVILETMQ